MSTAARKRSGWEALLLEVLRDIPRLEGAACRGRAGLFDAEEGEHQVRRARALCFACPVLPACAAWAGRQRNLVGVVAGRHRAPKRYDDGDTGPHKNEPRTGTSDD